jgi:hypothetical protein
MTIQQKSNSSGGQDPLSLFKSIDKREVFGKYKDLMMQSISTMDVTIADTQQRAREAPGAMQSKSDTSKRELSNLSNALSGRSIDLKTNLFLAGSLVGKTANAIGAGAMALLKLNGNQEVFFILPGGEGTSFQFSGLEINVLSPQAPVVKAMFGKKEGYSFEFNSNTWEIIGVK